MNIDFSCRCGALKGKLEGLSSSAVNRLVCYCDDCQAFAHFLEHPDEVLDENGGTEIMQMAPSRLKIEQGREQLACVRFSEKGPFRWYAACCNTPLGNTGDAGLPFLGVIHNIVDGIKEPERSRAFGPPLGAVFGKFARGINPGRMPLRLIFGFLRVIVASKLGGDQKRALFFDTSGEPTVQPRVLSKDEHNALLAQVAAGP